MTVFRLFASARVQAALISSSTLRFRASAKSPATLKSFATSLIFAFTINDTHYHPITTLVAKLYKFFAEKAFFCNLQFLFVGKPELVSATLNCIQTAETKTLKLDYFILISTGTWFEFFGSQ